MKILMKLRVKGMKKPFKEGWEPGILVKQEMSWDFPEGTSDSQIACALIDQEDAFLKENVEVMIEKVKE